MPKPKTKPAPPDLVAISRLLVARRDGWLHPLKAVADVYTALGKQLDPTMSNREQLEAAQYAVRRALAEADRLDTPGSASLTANMASLERALDDLSGLID